MTVFIIDDAYHAEWCGEFASFADALQELEARAKLPWDVKPNKCLCLSWKVCGRSYEIVEFDDSKKPWEEISRSMILEISSQGVRWI